MIKNDNNEYYNGYNVSLEWLTLVIIMVNHDYTILYLIMIATTVIRMVCKHCKNGSHHDNSDHNNC